MLHVWKYKFFIKIVDSHDKCCWWRQFLVYVKKYNVLNRVDKVRTTISAFRQIKWCKKYETKNWRKTILFLCRLLSRVLRIYKKWMHILILKPKRYLEVPQALCSLTRISHKRKRWFYQILVITVNIDILTILRKIYNCEKL